MDNLAIFHIKFGSEAVSFTVKIRKQFCGLDLVDLNSNLGGQRVNIGDFGAILHRGSDVILEWRHISITALLNLNVSF